MADNRSGTSSSGQSYKDPIYDTIEARMEKRYDLPAGIMHSIRTKGERSNADQVSSAAARSVYQIIPDTRARFLKKTGIDAYSGPEAAAEVAALHLKGSLDRGGDATQAVREYIGGTNPANYGPVTSAYVGRVTGQGGAPARPTNEQIAAAPSLQGLSVEQLMNMNPADLGNTRAPLTPTRKDPMESAAAKKQADLLSLTGGKPILTGGPRDLNPDWVQEVEGGKADVAVQTKKDSFSLFDQVGAAIEETWVVPQLAAAIDRAHPEADPGFYEHYRQNWQSIESFAQSANEVATLRGATSEADLAIRKAEIEKHRLNQEAIASNDHPIALSLATGFADPAGWLLGAGVGKAFQVAGMGSRMLLAGREAQAGIEAVAATEAVAPLVIGSRTGGEAGLLSGTSVTIPGRAAIPGVAAVAPVTAIAPRPIAAALAGGAEGLTGNLAFTMLADAAGQTQTSDDYELSALTGLGIGFALHGLHLSSGAIDKARNDNLERQAATIVQAAQALPEGATAKNIAAEAQRIHGARQLDLLRVSLADIPDRDKLLSENPDQLLTGDKAKLAGVTAKHGLDSIADDGERAMVAEHVARSEQIDAANPVNTDALSKTLSKVGMESTGLRLLASDSPVLRATSMQLLEGTTGAGGRRRTAAMAQTMRERVYNAAMHGYDDLATQFRRTEGGGVVNEFVTQESRKRFDSRVFAEVEARMNTADGHTFDTHPAVVQAADLWERGMNTMRLEQQHVGTIGSDNLGLVSRGYMRHMVAPDKVIALTPGQVKSVRAVLADEFVDPKNGFDRKFANKLAVIYLERAKGKGLGSFDVPMNLHDAQGADIVQDALEELMSKSSVNPEVQAMVAKYMRGGAGHTKKRLRMDLTRDIGGGKTLGDLFNKDISGLYRGYARRVSGEVALAQYGIMGKKGLNILRKAAEATGATGPELEAFDQIAAEFLNTPFGSQKGHKFMDNVRLATSVGRLGGMAFTQLGESGNGIAALGVARVFSSITAMPRLVKEVGMLAKGGEPKNPILGSIDLIGGNVGLDEFHLTRAFDVPDNDIQLYGREQVGVASRALRGAAHLQSVLSGHRMITAVQSRGMAEQIVHKAMSFIREGKEDVALKDMGISSELAGRIKAALPGIAEFDGTRLTKLDLATGHLAPADAVELVQAINRGASQIIQKTYIGETGKWAHDGLLKILTQFRTFSLISVEKQWGRNRANYGSIKSFTYLMGAMSFALPIHIARVQAKMVGMSRTEREKYATENLNAASMTRATMNYASASGLMGDIMDVGSGFASALGGDGGKEVGTYMGARGQGTNKLTQLVPATGLLDDLWAGVHGDTKKLYHALPGSNLPLVTPLINGLTADDGIDTPAETAAKAAQTDGNRRRKAAATAQPHIAPLF